MIKGDYNLSTTYVAVLPGIPEGIEVVWYNQSGICSTGKAAPFHFQRSDLYPIHARFEYDGIEYNISREISVKHRDFEMSLRCGRKVALIKSTLGPGAQVLDGGEAHGHWKYGGGLNFFEYVPLDPGVSNPRMDAEIFVLNPRGKIIEFSGRLCVDEWSSDLFNCSKDPRSFADTFSVYDVEIPLNPDTEDRIVVCGLHMPRGSIEHAEITMSFRY